jgi:acid phosphatase type 7
MDTDIANFSGGESARKSAWNEQVQWLEEDLKQAQGSEFRFVVGHHPPMTAVSYRQGDNAHMTALEPMFEQMRVTAAFFGHDHNYQHYLKSGVHYVIAGGGGAPLYDVDKPPAGITIKVQSIENFVRLQVEGKTVHVTAIAPDGTKLDTFEMEGAALAAEPPRKNQ